VPLLSLSSPAPAAAADYCRQARRLRARLGADPAKLYVALRELSRAAEHPTAPAATEVERFADSNAPGPARLFSSRVAAALDEGVLRYSARKDLLRDAAQMGLGNFEATLLIAAVQHSDRRAVRPAARNPSPRSSSATPLLALTALAIQTIIAAAVWWVVHV
jgi:hypothetical protein